MKKAIRVLVVVNTVLKAGGGFTYARNVLGLLRKIESDEYHFIYTSDKIETFRFLNSSGLPCSFLFPGWIQIVKSFIRGRGVLVGSRLQKIIRKFNIDLAYLLGPFPVWKALKNTCFIFTIHDLGHRDLVSFPELSWNTEFERREENYGQGSVRSFATFVDSSFTKEKLGLFYGVNEDKVFVVDFVTERRVVNDIIGPLEISRRYNIDSEYIFYPAQFWPHKNHIFILLGLVEYERLFGRRISAVFSGSDYGNLSYIRRTAEELGIADRIFYVGFVSERELVSLYCNALALVMPTFMTATNLPPLEAFMLKKPVLYPNSMPCVEILRRATLKIDLDDAATLGIQIERIREGDIEVTKKIEAGYEYVCRNLEEENMKVIKSVLDRFILHRRSWN